MARVLQSFTDATVDGEECWETLCDLDEADVDSVVEDIGVHCLVNGETAGYKDQCTGGSGASTEEAGGKRRRLTGKTVLQTSIAELSASVNWNDIICESLETLIHDEHLICTPRGKRSIEIASQVVDAKSSHEFECFCGDVGAKLLNCMSKAASRCRLPGTFRRKLWSHFHDLRTNSEFVNRWQTFVQSLKSECADDPLIFQCLLDQAFKKLISVHSGILYKPTEEPDVEILLTSREKNAIRYMAGFVMLRLKQRTTKNPLYQCILKQLCAKGQDLTVNSLDAYTTKWMDTISRGGLYHITDEVYKLMERIEVVLRHHLNIHKIKNYCPGEDLRTPVEQDILSNASVLSQWENISINVPERFEEHSVTLLEAIVKLWVTIRSYSFVQGWVERLEKPYKGKGTRKVLQDRSLNAED